MLGGGDLSIESRLFCAVEAAPCSIVHSLLMFCFIFQGVVLPLNTVATLQTLRAPSGKINLTSSILTWTSPSSGRAWLVGIGK